MDWLHLILTIIIVGVLLWAALKVLGALPVQEPFKTVAYVLIVVVAVLYLLKTLFGFSFSI